MTFLKKQKSEQVTSYWENDEKINRERKVNRNYLVGLGWSVNLKTKAEFEKDKKWADMFLRKWWKNYSGTKSKQNLFCWFGLVCEFKNRSEFGKTKNEQTTNYWENDEKIIKERKVNRNYLIGLGWSVNLKLKAEFEKDEKKMCWKYIREGKWSWVEKHVRNLKCYKIKFSVFTQTLVKFKNKTNKPKTNISGKKFVWTINN